MPTSALLRKTVINVAFYTFISFFEKLVIKTNFTKKKLKKQLYDKNLKLLKNIKYSVFKFQVFKVLTIILKLLLKHS